MHFCHKCLMLTITTLAIAGFVHLLEKAEWLRGLETRITTMALNTTSPEFLVGDLDEMPAVVVIDDRAYEDYFQRISPLDRPTLARVIDGLLATKPVLLAIDLDIGPSNAEEWKQALPLYELLCRHVRPDFGPGNAAATCLEQTKPPTRCNGLLLTVIEPFDAVSSQVQGTLQDWQKKMQAALGNCFSFAKALIEQHDAMVTQYNTAIDSLAIKSYMLLRQHRYPDWPPVAENQRGIIRMDLIKRANSELRFSHTPANNAEADERVHLAPSRIAFPVRAAPDGEFIAQHAPRPLSGNTQAVLLGGSWGSADKWYTPPNHPNNHDDKTSGVVIHAATLHSLVSPLSIAGKIALLALDLLFGVVFGAFFEWVWGRYNAAARHFRRQLPGHHLPFHPFLSGQLYQSYVPVFFYGSACLLLFILAFIVSLLLVAAGLSFGLWINVTFIVIGIILHQIIASREHVHADATLHAPANPAHAPVVPDMPLPTQDTASGRRNAFILKVTGLVLLWLRWAAIAALIVCLLEYKLTS